MAEINAEGMERDSVRKVATLEQLPLYIAVSRDVPEKIVDKWQETLDEMGRDGTSRKINQNGWVKFFSAHRKTRLKIKGKIK